MKEPHALPTTPALCCASRRPRPLAAREPSALPDERARICSRSLGAAVTRINLSLQPLAISRYSVVNGLGAGAQATLDALREKRSGLAPCNFETVELDTYVGRVGGLEER